MQADILDALAAYLNTNDLPVYYLTLPQGVPADQSEMPMCAVIDDGGEAESAGTRSYIQVARPRADLHCYGPTPYFAKKAYRELADRLNALTPVNVEVGPEDARVDVRLHNATRSGGPVTMIDPETKWPRTWSSWGVHGSTIEIGADVGVVVV